MSEYEAGIAARLAAVRDRMEQACSRVGRTPEDVRLVAVTKYVDADSLPAFAAAGLRECGENRWQAARDKIQLGLPFFWHFIGPLQRNKAKPVALHFDCVQSVDRAELADDLERYAAEAGRSLRVFIQVNVSGEPQKAGVRPDFAQTLAERAAGLPHLDLRGLMTIGTHAGGENIVRREFAALRTLRDRLKASTGLALPDLSMGMSDDYAIAIEEGATVIRVGRALLP